MVSAQDIDTCTREGIYLQRGDTCITGHVIHMTCYTYTPHTCILCYSTLEYRPQSLLSVLRTRCTSSMLVGAAVSSLLALLAVGLLNLLEPQQYQRHLVRTRTS